jgi:hypothetical protein
MLGWDRYGFDKKRTGTRYTKHVILHSVGYAGRVVNSGASRSQNIDALFFMLSWARYGFLQKCVQTCYTKLVFCIWLDMRVT